MHSKKKYYSWLPITCTLANSNLTLTWTKVDFPHTFIVILPSATRTLDNSNLPLTQSNFCFPSDTFYIILPSITWTTFKCVAGWPKKNGVLLYISPEHWIYFKTTLTILYHFFFTTSVQIQCLTLWSAHDTCIPSSSFCLFAYFWLFVSNCR